MGDNLTTQPISSSKQTKLAEKHSSEEVTASLKKTIGDCINANSDHGNSVIKKDNTSSSIRETEVSQSNQNVKEAPIGPVDVTSPGTLQDVSMDNSYIIGYRSSTASLQYQGSTSPATHGRSVREFEEQMATLRKENFNLKLRLYFIEESIPGYQQANSPEGQETLMKQLVDTRVEMEILRKEVQEKQEILQEAAQAMNQMETIQKETETKSQALVDELNQKIQFLEMEREMEKSETGKFSNILGSSDFTEIQRIRDLESVLKQSEEKITDLQKQINVLDDILAKRDDTIKEYEEKVKELVFQNAELLESLDKKEKQLSNVELQCFRDELQECKTKLADKTCMLEEAEEQLKNRTQIHEQACRTIQKLMQRIKNQQKEINKIKNQACETTDQSNKNEISDDDANILSGNECTGLCNVINNSDIFTDVSNKQQQEQKFEAIIREKDELIGSLKAEVRKKTANLQNLVNNELWEKNREIERLTKLINRTEANVIMSPKQNISRNELLHSFSDSEYIKALERNKLLQKKVDVLIQRLCEDRNNDDLIAKLREELRDARNEAECSEKWRLECVEVCTVLSNRLEELAGFLNSLLMNKDVLCLLAPERHGAIQKAVNRSLDLSKSLNMTLSISGVSMVERSLLNLSNISEFAFGSENKTFNSHEELNAQKSIQTLKAENKALKNELEKRRSTEPFKKDRRSLPIGTIEAQSESEAWSEPDRKVSLARIGLEDLSISVAKSVSGVGTTGKLLETDSEESDAFNQSRSSKTVRALDRIPHLEQMITQRDDRILKIQCQLVDADNRLKIESLKVLDLTCEVEKLRKQNKGLQESLLAMRSGSNDKSDIKSEESLLRKQIEEKSRSLELINDERDRIAADLRVAEKQIESLKTEMEDLKIKHEEALKFAHEEQKIKLNKLQTDMEELMQERLSEQERQQEERLKHDWIARNLYEMTQNKLKELECQLKESQSTIDYLNENEKEMKQSMVDSELAIRSLKKLLDESTLQTSKAVLERTKALTDKLNLEKRIQEMTVQLQLNETERTALKCKMQNLEDDYSSKLQEISKLQTKTNSINFSKSGYTSEDLPTSSTTTTCNERSTVKRGTEVNVQRLSTTSPDLGIESDAGRAASIEISNSHRQVLKTVEMSVNNVIKEESIDMSEDVKPTNLPISMLNSNPPHDCAKVDQENIELRRKLTRTKRSLVQTYEQLRISNQRKAQIEQDIKKQIVKTHTVLRNVRSNMENEF